MSDRFPMTLYISGNKPYMKYGSINRPPAPDCVVLSFSFFKGVSEKSLNVGIQQDWVTDFRKYFGFVIST